MEPYEENLNENPTPEPEHVRPGRWMIVAIIALLGAAGIASSYAVHEASEVQQLTDQTKQAKVETNQLQAQVNTLTARLNDLTAAQSMNASGKPIVPASTTDESNEVTPPPVIAPSSTPSPSPAIAPTAKPAAPKHTAKRRPQTDKRYDQLKAQLDDEQKQLKETQDEVAKNRSDLEGSLSSTRDELNGSIAKTHDELVALEKRGERSFFEFDLSKSKEFQRIGPMSLSLRKSDTKHKNYDLAMLVDDNELSKKKVNLYEPVWIHTDAGQSLQVVVNHIAKDEVRGYISAPKYKESELPALSSSSSTQPPNGSQPSQQ